MEIIALTKEELQQILRITWNRAQKEVDITNGAECNENYQLSRLTFREVE